MSTQTREDQARLLDNHSLFNVAIALTDFGTPEYYAAARALREIAFRYARDLPAGTSLILTNVISSGGVSGFAEEHWQAVRDLARDRGVPLASVTLVCDPVEHAERIAAPERRLNKKMRDVEEIARVAASRALFDEGADYRTSFDTTAISAGVCAERIAAWLWEQAGGATP